MSLKTTQIQKYITCTFCLIVLSYGCKNQTTENVQETVSNENIENKVVKINDEIYSVPSAFHFTNLIKKGGASYKKEILNSPDKADQYPNHYSKSLILGIYSADLGYVTAYDQSQEALAYIETIKKIADPIGLEGIFNKNLVNRFSTNIGNRDSLQKIIAGAYLSADSYLKDNERMHTSALILAGSWIESLYLATNTYRLQPGDYIKYRIAEQKASLNSLIKSLIQFDVNYQLIDQLKDLYTVYEKINLNYKYVRPITDQESKTTTLLGKTEVEITEEQLKLISNKIEAIRNEIVG